MLGFQWSLAPSLLFFAARSAFFALERPRPILFAGLVGGRLQRARQLRPHLRAAWNAAARDFRVGARNHAFPDADGLSAYRGLARSIRASAACGCSLFPGGRAARDGRALAARPADRRRRSSPRSASSPRRLCLSASSTERRSKRIQSLCRSPRSPSWSRSASDRPRPFGSDMLMARATRSRSPRGLVRLRPHPRFRRFCPRRRCSLRRVS